MKWNFYVWLAFASSFSLELLAAEKSALDTILNKDEANQHQQLALSLRNQKLLEQQAESRAKQLLFQLQAAEAWAAIQRLGVQVNSVAVNEHEDLGNAEIYTSVPNEFLGYKAFAIIKHSDTWIARIGDAHRVITVRNGSDLKPGIKVRVDKNIVELIGKGWQYQISME